MFPGANNEAVRTCRCHTLLARPNHLDLAVDLFHSKAADPVDLVNQGDPKTSQIYKFLKGYQNGKKFVDIDILGATLFNQVGLVVVLSVSSFAN